MNVRERYGWYDADWIPCPRCGGDGQYVECYDDLCHAQGRCMHGDNLCALCQGVGEITDADTIPQSADELVRLEGISAVVVMGERDGVLHLSGRSRDDRVHMGEALESAVADVPMASAGGHARMGGGQLSIDHMEGIGPSDGMNVPEFSQRLFECLRGDV